MKRKGGEEERREAASGNNDLAVDRKSGTKFLMFYAKRDIENRHNECRFLCPGRARHNIVANREGTKTQSVSAPNLVKHEMVLHIGSLIFLHPPQFSLQSISSRQVKVDRLFPIRHRRLLTDIQALSPMGTRTSRKDPQRKSIRSRNSYEMRRNRKPQKRTKQIDYFTRCEAFCSQLAE
jgi:hypothetical protein